MTRREAPKDLVGRGLVKRARTTPELPKMGGSAMGTNKQQVEKDYREFERLCPRSAKNQELGSSSKPYTEVVKFDSGPLE